MLIINFEQELQTFHSVFFWYSGGLNAMQSMKKKAIAIQLIDILGSEQEMDILIHLCIDTRQSIDVTET